MNYLKRILISFLILPLFSVVAISASVEVLQDTNKAWNGTKIPSVDIKNTQVKVLRIVIKAGEKLPMHKHPVVNVGYLVKGNLNVITEKGKVLKLKAGDSIVEVINQWHYGQNVGTTDAEIVVFYVGDKNQPITIKK
ncbi:MAG: cupin domain-containing protein [Alphaproteobacteria bacterium]